MRTPSTLRTRSILEKGDATNTKDTQPTQDDILTEHSQIAIQEQTTTAYFGLQIGILDYHLGSKISAVTKQQWQEKVVKISKLEFKLKRPRTRNKEPKIVMAIL